MPKTYRFQVYIPVDTNLPEDEFCNVFHLEHVAGLAVQTDLDQMADDINAMYQQRLGFGAAKVRTQVYDVGPPPNPPLSIRSAGTMLMTAKAPRELCLCLSVYADRHNKRKRGRLYIPSCLQSPAQTDPIPSGTAQNWALAWYATSNGSLPDLGGPDWKFGVYSRVDGTFNQSKGAWVDNAWDIQRRRGLAPTSRVESIREG